MKTHRISCFVYVLVLCLAWLPEPTDFDERGQPRFLQPTLQRVREHEPVAFEVRVEQAMGQSEGRLLAQRWKRPAGQPVQQDAHRLARVSQLPSVDDRTVLDRCPAGFGARRRLLRRPAGGGA